VPISRQDRVNYWRALAADVLAAAVDASEPDIRVTLFAIAAFYDDLAIKAELAVGPMTSVAQPVRGQADKRD